MAFLSPYFHGIINAVVTIFQQLQQNINDTGGKTYGTYLLYKTRTNHMECGK